MAEPADAYASGAYEATHVGSTPTMPTMKIIVLLTALLLIFCFFVFFELNAEVTINHCVFQAETAILPKELEKGLSQRDSLEQNQGMLFLFPSLRKPAFWMKGMNFPLDILWLKGDAIVEINENVPLFTQGNVTTIIPHQEINKVLELKPGTASECEIKPGDKATFHYYFELNKKTF